MNAPQAKQRAARENRFYYRLARLLKLAFIIYFSILAILMISETSLVFPGAGIDRGDWNHIGLDLEEVNFQSEDGTKIYGYFLPRLNADGTLLFCHGNEENIATCAEEADRLREALNVSVLVFDYRGYGKSDGRPSETKILQDSEAALSWLADKTRTDPSELVLFGRSLGGGVVVHLASRHGAKALILDRTFSSAVDVAANRFWWLPVRFVMRNQFLSVAKIHYYEGPLIQFHGDIDEVIPVWSARKLFDRSPSPDKEWRLVGGLTHKVPMPESYYADLRAWFAARKADDAESNPKVSTP